MSQAETTRDIMKRCIMRDEQPKVSVLLSVHNHEDYVGAAIESVLRQTYQDWELIIIDDCSEDGSADVIRNYQDDRIQFYQAEENQGAILIFNELLKKAGGEYIASIDSDDIWYDNKLEEQIAYLEQHRETAACFSWAEFIDQEGDLYSITRKECDCDIRLFMHENRTQGQCFRYFFDNDNYLCRSSAVLRSDAVKEIGGFDPRFRVLHDYEYWVRLIQKYPIYLIQKPLVQYRRVSVDNNSLSAVNRKNVIRVINEHQMIVYNMIKEMDRTIFCDAFHDLLKKEVASEAHLICEKYFVLLRWTMLGVNNRQVALRYFHDCMDAEAMECLKQEYGYSWKDYYIEMEDTWQLYPLDFYKDYQTLEEIHANTDKAYTNLLGAFQEQGREMSRLTGEIHRMSRTCSWRITKPLRAARRVFSGKKHGR